MKAVQVTCPNCGARLAVADALVVSCEYCGTSSRVQRRTTVFQRVLPPPQAGPPSIAVQTASSGARWAVVFGIVFALGSTAAVGYVVSRTTARVRDAAGPGGAARPSAAVATPKLMPPQNSDVLVADIDGDGGLDAIIRTRQVTPRDEIRLAAIDGRTGEPRWTSDVLGTYIDTYQGVLALVGDKLVFGSPRGELRAFALASGAAGWSTRLDERPKRFCAGIDDATFVVIGADDVPRVVLRATGEAASAEATVPARWKCAPLPTGETSRARSTDWNLGRKHDISIGSVVSGPSGRVLLGQRPKGTRAPMLVVLAPDGAVRWKLVLPEDPLAAKEDAPEDGVITDREVCASYVRDRDQMHVACFALEDGRRLWDVPVPSNGRMTLIDRGLLMVARGQLTRLDLANSATVWRYPK